MREPSLKDYKPDIKEQQRLVIAVAIVGTVVALYALPVTSTDLWSLTRGFMLFPGVFAFLFLLTTGAYLKYKEPGRIGEVDIAHSVRKLTYNWMIDLFWTGFFVSVVFFVATIFGWNGKDVSGAYWLGLGLGGAICFAIALIGLFLWLKENKK